MQAPTSSEGSPGCVPACRSGFICLEGKCVEACNPPCGSGERCVDEGECVAAAAAGGRVNGAPPSFFPPDSQAMEAPQEPGVEAHDGFMLRMTLGFGGGSAEYELAGSRYESSGPATSFSLDVGGALSENFVLHGRLSEVAMEEPALSIDGEEIATFDNGRVVSFLFGPALTYYFMPINLYATVAIGISVGTGDDGERTTEGSDVGWGLNLDVGKEWWIGEQWGLGVAMRLFVSSAPEQTYSADGVDVDTRALTVLLSATYQ